MKTIIEPRKNINSGVEQILVALQKEIILNKLNSNSDSSTLPEQHKRFAFIRSGIEMLKTNLTRTVSPEKNQQPEKNDIQTEIEHLSELIDNFIIAGKNESNTITCKKVPVNLYLLLKRIITNLNQAQEDQRAVILIAGDQELPVKADPFLIKHVLRIIISNALKYSSGSQQPIITVIYEERTVQIQITVFGESNPTNLQNKISQTLSKAVPTRHAHEIGLGLFITPNFTELLGGSVSFKSIMGTGSEFTVTLPIN